MSSGRSRRGGISRAHATFDECRRAFVVLAYCVMPDHAHLLLEGIDETADVREAMRAWKQRTGFDWKRRTRTPLWQEGFHDRVLRDSDDTRAVVRYVLDELLDHAGALTPSWK